MKNKLLTILAVLFITVSYSQNNKHLTVLNKYIIANNVGTTEAFSKFIKDTYNPQLFNKINVKSHIDFYTMISKDFGRLKLEVYKKTEENPSRLVVHLIKDNESLFNKKINPAEVLVVEMDFNKNNASRLKKGMGLGALVCELKK
jgi:hypothetical protein